MKKLVITLIFVVFTVSGNATANSTRDKNFTEWIDADAACSRAYDAWLDAKQTEEAAIAQEVAALADWQTAKARRDKAYAGWQQADNETPARLRK